MKTKWIMYYIAALLAICISTLGGLLQNAEVLTIGIVIGFVCVFFGMFMYFDEGW